MNMLPPNDLEHILRHTKNLWKELRGQNIFLTGGTGFFGKWLLGTFLAANDRFKLQAALTVLSRNPQKFARNFPAIAAHPALRFIKGDVRNFSFPRGNFAYVIHGAVDANLKLIQEQPLLIFDTIVQGTRRVLDFAQTHGVKKMLLISSGAVYGRQPPNIHRLSEEYRRAPDFTGRYAVYGVALRAVETLCRPYAAGFQPRIARCFSFVGPYLPLDQHFAIGNFIRDALAGKKIRIEGDGAPRRSYLYAADLAIWLWTILLRGKSGRTYNVGSENAVALAQAANLVARLSPNAPGVVIKAKPHPKQKADLYVPSTMRARTELGLKETVNLREAINRTLDFYCSSNNCKREK